MGLWDYITMITICHVPCKWYTSNCNFPLLHHKLWCIWIVSYNHSSLILAIKESRNTWFPKLDSFRWNEIPHWRKWKTLSCVRKNHTHHMRIWKNSGEEKKEHGIWLLLLSRCIRSFSPFFVLLHFIRRSTCARLSHVWVVPNQSFSSLFACLSSRPWYSCVVFNPSPLP